MMGAQNALLVKTARIKLGLPERGPVELAMLDALFLEPERARITEMPMTEQGRAMLASRELLRPDRLFSAAELRNDILAIEAAYSEFDLKDTDFSPAAALVRRLSRDFIDRDFWITVTPAILPSSGMRSMHRQHCGRRLLTTYPAIWHAYRRMRRWSWLMASTGRLLPF